MWNNARMLKQIFFPHHLFFVSLYGKKSQEPSTQERSRTTCAEHWFSAAFAGETGPPTLRCHCGSPTALKYLGGIGHTVRRVKELLASHLFQQLEHLTEASALTKVIKDFYSIAQFPGATGCIDCMHIEINSQGGEDAEVFRNCKGYFSINVQASGRSCAMENSNSLFGQHYTCCCFERTINNVLPANALCNSFTLDKYCTPCSLHQFLKACLFSHSLV